MFDIPSTSEIKADKKTEAGFLLGLIFTPMEVATMGYLEGQCHKVELFSSKFYFSLFKTLLVY